MTALLSGGSSDINVLILYLLHIIIWLVGMECVPSNTRLVDCSRASVMGTCLRSEDIALEQCYQIQGIVPRLREFLWCLGTRIV